MESVMSEQVAQRMRSDEKSREEKESKEGKGKSKGSIGFTASDFGAFLSFTSCPLIETFFMDIIPAHGFTEYGVLHRSFTQIFKANRTRD